MQAASQRTLICLCVAFWLSQGVASAQDTETGSVPNEPPRTETRSVVSVQSPVLTVDSERLFNDSAFGRQVVAELEVAGRKLQSENNEIAAALEAEELELTLKRPDMEPEAFRELAAAFDKKTERIRAERSEAARAISRRLDEERRRFLSAAVPVLQEIMIEAGAAVVLEQRGVLISVRAVDITTTAIERLDAQFEADSLRQP